MKKGLLFALLPVAALLFLVSCDTGAEADYYPLTVGSVWRYSGYMTISTSLDGVDTVWTSVIKVEATKKDNLTSGEEVTELVSIDTSNIKFPTPRTDVTTHTTYSREAGDYVLVYGSKDDTEPDTLLALPLEQGKSWNVSAHGDTVTAATVEAKEDVTVPAGKQTDCWKLRLSVRVAAETLYTQYMWLADGIGHVLTSVEYEQQGTTVKSEIKLTSADVK